MHELFLSAAYIPLTLQVTCCCVKLLNHKESDNGKKYNYFKFLNISHSIYLYVSFGFKVLHSTKAALAFVLFMLTYFVLHTDFC